MTGTDARTGAPIGDQDGAGATEPHKFYILRGWSTESRGRPTSRNKTIIRFMANPKPALAYRRRNVSPNGASGTPTATELIGLGNGNWSGRLVAEGPPITGDISLSIQAKNCTFEKLVLENAVFQEPVDFSGSVFNAGLVLRNVKFQKGVSFQECRFEGAFAGIQFECEAAAMFYRADFVGDALIRANFKGSANFNESIFREGARLTGWRLIHGSFALQAPILTSASGTVSNGTTPSVRERIYAGATLVVKSAASLLEKLWKGVVAAYKMVRHKANLLRRRFATSDKTQFFPLFEAEGQFVSVALLKPAQVVFSDAELSRVYFDRTNLRGVRFLGVNFWQPRLGRSGLHDEIFVRLNPDGPFRHRQLPFLEETCRNMRVAMEENRSYAAASDFYIAEMEALRAQLSPLRRHLLSVPALYRAVSRYGSSVGAALWMLVLLFALHMSVTLLLKSRSEQVDSTDVHAISLRSAKVVLYQPIDHEAANTPPAQVWTDLLFRLLGPAQLAMLVLAFRTRLKRH